jgi:hypothetical protein
MLSIARAVLRSFQVDVELLSLAASPAGGVLLALGLCFFMGGRLAPQLDGALSLDMALREYRGANTSLRTRYEALAAARERLGLRSRLGGRLRWLSGRREVERPQRWWQDRLRFDVVVGESDLWRGRFPIGGETQVCYGGEYAEAYPQEYCAQDVGGIARHGD